MADNDTVHITFGPDYRDHAVLLLAAAEELDLDASVVATTDHGFSVPAKVAEKAGVDADTDEEAEPDNEPTPAGTYEPPIPDGTEPTPTEEPKPKPARKTAAKAPRKTAAKRTAAPKVKE